MLRVSLLTGLIRQIAGDGLLIKLTGVFTFSSSSSYTRNNASTRVHFKQSLKKKRKKRNRTHISNIRGVVLTKILFTVGVCVICPAAVQTADQLPGLVPTF